MEAGGQRPESLEQGERWGLKDQGMERVVCEPKGLGLSGLRTGNGESTELGPEELV
jgi:hypothetical protein